MTLSRTPQALISWTAPQSYTYIQLKAGVEAEQIERRFPSFIDQYMAAVIEERQGRGAWLKEQPTIVFTLQNLKDVHLHSQHIGGGEGSDIRKSLILGAIGLLVLLIENLGTILTHKQILERVWGWEYIDDVDYVRIYIAHLRQKLEPEPAQPKYILTEPGVGYYFPKSH